MDLFSSPVDFYRRLRSREARRRAVQELRRSMVLIVEPEALAASVANRMRELFDPDRLVIFERDPDDEARFRVAFASGLDDEPDAFAEPSLGTEGRLARWFRVNGTCLRVDAQRGVVDFLDPEEKEILERLDARLVAPLRASNRLIGLVLLGSARSVWSKAEADLLLEIAEHVSLAFQNASLYRAQQERLDRLHRADRLAAIGQLAAGVAHEVRNPLTAIRSTMQYLASRLEETPGEMVAELIEEVDRIDHIIGGLLDLTHSDALERRPIDLEDVLDQTARLLSVRARKSGVHLETLLEPAPLEADPAQLKQVFLNLSLNALQVLDEGGRLTFACGRGDDGWAWAEVRDDGPGIPEENLSKIFDPFFTTKAEGTGLGLSICQRVIVQHGGRLGIESVVGEGTTVSIRLPALVREPPPDPPTAPDEEETCPTS